MFTAVVTETGCENITTDLADDTDAATFTMDRVLMLDTFEEDDDVAAITKSIEIIGM